MKNLIRWVSKKGSIPFVLIFLGIIFLIQNLGIVTGAFSDFWPLILVIIGLVKLAESADVKEKKD